MQVTSCCGPQTITAHVTAAMYRLSQHMLLLRPTNHHRTLCCCSLQSITAHAAAAAAANGFCVFVQDITNVSPWSQITAQFQLFNSGNSSSSPSTSTAGRRLLRDSATQDSDLMLRAAEAHSADQGSGRLQVGLQSPHRQLLQNGSSGRGGNSSYADFEAADTVNSDLTREGKF